MKKLLPILLLFIGVFSLSAQVEVKVEGFVKSETGVPLMGIDLQIIATGCAGEITYQSETAKTNVDGYYAFSLTACQDVYVSVSMICRNETIYQNGTIDSVGALISLDFVCNDVTNSCYVDVEVEYIDDYALLTAYPGGGSSPYSYYWSDGTLEYNTEVGTAGEYCVTIVDATGCQAVGCAYVQLGDTTNYCNVDFSFGADSVQSESGGFIYWFKADMLNAPSEDYTYVWNFSGNQSGSGREFTQYFEKAGMYNVCVTATNAAGVSCIICKDIEVKDNQPDDCYVDVEVEYIDDYALLTAYPGGGSSPYSYYWSDGTLEYNTEVGTAGEYCVTIVDATGCQAVKCVYVELVDSTNFCEVDFRYGADSIQSESGGYIYWFKADILNGSEEDYTFTWDLSQNQTGSGREFIHYFEEPGTYYVCVTATNAAGVSCEWCKDVFVLAGENTDSCFVDIRVDYKDGYALLDAFPDSQSDPYSFYWSDGGLEHDTEVETSGEYCVSVVDAEGCLATACVFVELTDTTGAGCQLAFDHHPDSLESTIGAFLEYFNAWTLDGNSSLYTYKWQFGDGQLAEGQNVDHTYTSEGKYYVCVEAWDGDKFVCSWCQEISVGDDDFCIDPTKIDSTANCPDVYEPVCGCDGVTYDNECIALAHGVVEWERGTCDGGCQLAFAYHPDSLGNTPGALLTHFNAWTLDGHSFDYTYKWQFGDGQLEEGQNVDHIYTSGGKYEVCVEAWDGDKFVCSWCQDIYVDETCLVDFTFQQEPFNPDGTFLSFFDAWTLNPNGNDYNYKWQFGDGLTGEGQNIEHAYTAAGVYTVCVEAWDSLGASCIWCLDVIIEDYSYCINPEMVNDTIICETDHTPVCGCDGVTYENACIAENRYGVTEWFHGPCDTTTTYCDINFEFYVDTFDVNSGIWTYNFNAKLGGTDPAGFEYQWDFGNGQTATGDFVTGEFTSQGEYIICLKAIGPDGKICSICLPVYIGDIPDYLECDIQILADIDSVGNGAKFSVELKEGEPDFYYWVFEDGTTSTEATPYHDFGAVGNYLVCVEVADSLGRQCGWCELFFIGEEDNFEDDCLSHDQINLDVECNEEYQPVCGCDGVTYYNECVAKNYYGIKEWTTGACDGGIPTDTIPSCDLTFEYNIYTDNHGKFLVEFFGEHALLADYRWDFGDGSTSEEEMPIHHYENLTSEPAAYTVCLYVLAYTDTNSDNYCLSEYCETIILEPNPDNIVAGGVYADDEGITGRRGITRRNGSAGEPLADVTVHLLDAQGKMISTDVTDAAGQYSFDGLLFGNYQIQLMIEGITHDPFELKLDPQNQEVESLDFEVSDEAVTTSSEDLSFANNIKMYPNPTDAAIFVELNLLESLPLTIKIHNLFGQEIQVVEQDFNKGNQKMKFSLENAVPGVYLITIQSAKETFSRKIILQ